MWIQVQQVLGMMVGWWHWWDWRPMFDTWRHLGECHGWCAAAIHCLCTFVLSLLRGRPVGQILYTLNADMFPYACGFAEDAIAAWAVGFGSAGSQSKPWWMLLRSLCSTCLVYPVWGFVVLVVGQFFCTLVFLLTFGVVLLSVCVVGAVVCCAVVGFAILAGCCDCSGPSIGFLWRKFAVVRLKDIYAIFKVGFEQLSFKWNK